MPKPRHDWAAIEHEYVTGNATMRELAAKYGVAMSSFAKHAKRNKYAEQRNRYGTETVQEAVKKTQEVDARGLAARMQGLREFADDAIDVLRKNIKSEDTLYNYVTGGSDGPREVRLNKLDTKAFRDMMYAGNQAAQMLMTLHPDESAAGGDQAILIMPDRDEDEE